LQNAKSFERHGVAFDFACSDYLTVTSLLSKTAVRLDCQPIIISQSLVIINPLRSAISFLGLASGLMHRRTIRKHSKCFRRFRPNVDGDDINS